MLVAMTKTQLVGLLLGVWLVAQGMAFLLVAPALPKGHTFLYWVGVAFGAYLFVYHWRKLYWRPA